MIQRIQSIYFLVAAILVFWVGFGNSILEIQLKSETQTTDIIFNLNGYGWQANTDANVSQTIKTKIQATSSKNKFEHHETSNSIALQQNYPVYITFCVIGLCLIIVIFMFKDTKKQLRLAKITLFILILSVLSVVLFYIIAPSGITQYCSKIFQNSFQQSSSLGLEFYLLCASICFVLLGISSIKKDRKLVQSLDRIR